MVGPSVSVGIDMLIITAVTRDVYGPFVRFPTRHLPRQNRSSGGPEFPMTTATGGSTMATTDIPIATGTDTRRTRSHATEINATQLPMSTK
jgi:hypothetical protein